MRGDGTGPYRIGWAAAARMPAGLSTGTIRRHPQDWHVLQPVWPPPAGDGHR